ncbi:kinesin-like protein KIF28P isoform X2 [Strongylocentrotus purpuratus]|uniref:Kinesin-like protein 6 n=1 Tax=Strongylocentrotus purpuratus TaxID=7668 RepID=A0A7M7HN12_STRPU|nr:kinesin-like protein KIF28P isoform X2 [Strongylocentrotus purpuratus]|eukprot:XP_011668890.1 PREDICTED: kinesin-like protein KIF28P [Strongylocentrotus purpuratus]
MAESVKVAVRCRPFNSREKARNAKLIIDMNGNTTTISDPEAPNEEPRKFNFDYSYWSHDGYTVPATDDGYLEASNKKYCDQKRVFEDLGRGVLANAWQGYNSCLFAYGQTGSGKSYSMVGYGENKGIVPIFCDKIFQEIDQKKSEGTKAEYEVSYSMLEIYNEQVRDLLNPASKKKGGLKIREHPKKGFYVESLRQTPVQSYVEIQARMDEGVRNRTVAATQMNATSSRAHTIMSIIFTQKSVNDAGQEMAKTSVANLVDLAGSERAESTGATGDRLKEGAAINQSLSSLGNVISALADKSKGKNVKVPFRDSALTKLLKNALGGNSKTIMVAALSPADINYDETLSTLRYADRAKQIKTIAVVNEDPTEKLIRELKEENARLMDAIKAGGIVAAAPSDQETAGMTEEEKDRLKQEMEEEMAARLSDNEKEMEEMKKTWEDKLRQAQASNVGDDSERAKKEARKNTPHLFNLNIDPALSGMIVHILAPGTYNVGSDKAENKPQIVLNGLSIQKEHAVITNEGGKAFIEKVSPMAKLLVNGDPITSKMELDHNDRVMFGSNHLYVFKHPALKKADPKKYGVVTYEMAQQEIAEKNGFDMSSKKTGEDLLLQEELVEMIPMVEEANAISEELDRKVKFEIVVMSPKARGLAHGRTEVCVKLRNLQNELEYIWSRDKFVRRKYLMQEMYENFADGSDWQLPEEKDPFTEPLNTNIQIGVVNVYLQSMAYMIETRESLEISDYRGKQQGLLDVEIIPCDDKGKELTEADDVFVDDPKDLISRCVNFVIKIKTVTGVPNRFKDIYCNYKMYLESEENKTDCKDSAGMSDFAFRKFYNFQVATSQLVDYLQNGMLTISVWGRQEPKTSSRTKNLNTAQIMMSETLAKGSSSASVATMETSGEGGSAVDSNKVAHHFQLAIFKKKQERMEMKMNQMKKMLEVAERNGKERIQTEVIKQLLIASNNQIADKIIARIPKDQGGGTSSNGGGHAPKGETSSSVCTIM